MSTAHASADQRFASTLYAQLASDSGNLVFSPASIRIALAMASLGARGETAAEMTAALAFTGKADHEDLMTVLSEWRAREDPAAGPGSPPWEKEYRQRQREVLRVVNRLWGQTGYAFRSEFVEALRSIYASSMQLLDFASDREASRRTINDWVKDQTGGRIADLLSPMHVLPETRMILTNAVYLKAAWEQEFLEPATSEKPFWTSATSSVPAKLMSQTTTFGYAEDRSCQIVELPYASGKLGLVIVLPRARDGLPHIEQEVARKGIEPWLGQRSPALVRLVLPRFRATSSLSLREVLCRLGMARAFQLGPANFSGIDGTRELFLSDAIHQAFIAVDEHGTEAAAATALVACAGCAPGLSPVPKEFRADHPFLFLLRDIENGRVVFMGRVIDPRDRLTN